MPPEVRSTTQVDNSASCSAGRHVVVEFGSFTCNPFKQLQCQNKFRREQDKKRIFFPLTVIYARSYCVMTRITVSFHGNSKVMCIVEELA